MVEIEISLFCVIGMGFGGGGGKGGRRGRSCLRVFKEGVGRGAFFCLANTLHYINYAT